MLSPKKPKILAALIGLSLTLTGLGQTTYTPIAGYVKLQAAAASSPTEPTFSFVSHSLSQQRKSAGVITTGGTDTITASASTWGVDDYAGINGPHYVLMTDGALEGQLYEIASNTVDTLTLALGSGDTSSLVNDSFCVYKHNTLGSIFGDDPEGSGVQGGLTDTVADQVFLYDTGTGSFKSYFFRNERDFFQPLEIDDDWVQTGDNFTNASGTVIGPNQGFIYLRRDDSTALDIPVFGDVIDSSISLQIIPGFNLITVPTPVDTGVTLGNSGLAVPLVSEDLDIHLQGGLNDNVADTVFIWNGSGYDSYFFRNERDFFQPTEIEDDWVKTGDNFTSAAGTTLEPGSFFIMRKATNPPLQWVLPNVLP